MLDYTKLELKNVINYHGHEEEDLIECDVYYDGKKIAHLYQHTWGGEDTIKTTPDYDAFIEEVGLQSLKDLHNKQYEKWIKDLPNLACRGNPDEIIHLLVGEASAYADILNDQKTAICIGTTASYAPIRVESAKTGEAKSLETLLSAWSKNRIDKEIAHVRKKIKNAKVLNTNISGKHKDKFNPEDLHRWGID